MAIQTMISTKAKLNFGSLIEFAIRGGATIVERYSRPAAVVISYDEWQSLRKMHTDLLRERQAEADIPWEEAKAQLVAEGLLDG